VRLSDGPLTDAVLAAAAIPGVLPPVRWRGRLLADGGIADNTPVSRRRRHPEVFVPGGCRHRRHVPRLDQ
jgi:predicted acylesterase/phospholipase RssA